MIKARPDLEDNKIRPKLWLNDNGNGKFLKPHPKYSFKPQDKTKFCQYIKRVKLPDGFGSYWKHKVNDDNSNITNMKSHDCHIMMQRLLPYEVKRYLPKEVATPIIELCYFFKQICASNLTTLDMLKAKDQIINILCSLKKISPPAFFDIMVHLVIHLPDEAIQGGPSRYRSMWSFERYMKKLKNYVRNKIKPKGSIAEAYIAEEALTYCSHYLKCVDTRFNRLDRNEDEVDVTNNFQVFRSVCKLLGKEVYTSLNTDVMQKVTWYVLNNSPQIDADIVAYKNEFSSNNVEKEFPRWINDEMRQKRVNNDPSCTPELFSLACGPSSNATLYTACLVNGVRFMVHDRDINRTTQNSEVSTPGPNEETYYGQLEQILELTYIGCNKARQVFYLDDPARRPLQRKVVEDVNHTKKWHQDIIVVEDNEDVIHDNTSSNVALSADSDDLDFENIEDVAIDIGDNEEDFVVDSNNEVKPMAYVGGKSHGGDAGGEPPREPNRIPNQCEGSVVRGTTTNKEFRKAISRNKNRPLPLKFDDKDQKTFKAVGDNQNHFYNYIGELLCNFPFNYDKWAKVPEVHKTVLIPSLEGFFDLRRHLNDLTIITVRGKLHTVGSLVRAGLQCNFKDQWKDKKNKLKAKGFSKYDSVQEAREKPPPDDRKRTAEEWQELIDFWADPKRMNIAKKNAQNRAKKKTTRHQGSKSFAQGRHEFMERTGEYEDVISHWKDTHTNKDGVFKYANEEILNNQMIAMHKQVADCVIAPLTSDEIMDRVLDSNDRGHIPGRGRIVTGTGSSHPPLSGVDYISQAAWNAEREVLLREAQDSNFGSKGTKRAKKARNEAKSSVINLCVMKTNMKTKIKMETKMIMMTSRDFISFSSLDEVFRVQVPWEGLRRCMRLNVSVSIRTLSLANSHHPKTFT
nr:hypothetical protein [Tanacetum cinerariifolium]